MISRVSERTERGFDRIPKICWKRAIIRYLLLNFYPRPRTLDSNSLQTTGGFFYIPSPLGERLMIPLKYLDELKTAPVNHVDFVGTFIEVRSGC